MFRPMRRIKQQLNEEEALDVLKNAKRGVLSVIGDGCYESCIVAVEGNQIELTI